MNPGPGRWFWRLGLLAFALLAYMLIVTVKDVPPLGAAIFVGILWSGAMILGYRTFGRKK